VNSQSLHQTGHGAPATLPPLPTTLPPLLCQDPASTSPLGSTGNVARFHGALFSYSHFRRTHTSGVLTHLAWARCSHGIRHARCGLFAALLTRLAWACGSHGIRHARRGLFAAHLSRLAWARCSHGIRHARCGLFAALLTRLAWARGSCGIRHARRGLFGALLTYLAWARCSSWEWWSRRRSRGCRGRSVGRDNMQLQSIARNATGYLCSTCRTTPVGLPSLPNPTNRRTEETKVIAERKFWRKKAESKQARRVNVALHWGGGACHHPFFPSCMAWSRFEGTEVWLR